MTDDRLQRIEEMLTAIRVQLERSLAAGEARVDHCHERFALNEAAIAKVAGKVQGNGSIGMETRLDRIEQKMATSSRWFWSGIAFLQAVTVVLIKYVLP